MLIVVNGWNKKTTSTEVEGDTGKRRDHMLACF